MPLVPQKSVRPRVQELLAQGFTVREVSKLVDVTTQRVYQLKWEIERAEKESTESEVSN